jgi:hypothetical protein
LRSRPLIDARSPSSIATWPGPFAREPMNFARVLAVEHVVGPDDHVHLTLRRSDVDADDGDVLARRIVEGRGDGGAVDRIDDQSVDAFVDQRPDLRRLLAGVTVRRDRADERNAVLRRRCLLERNVGAPEVRAVAGERNADLDARLLRVHAAGRRHRHRERTDEPDERERAENSKLHRLILLGFGRL